MRESAHQRHLTKQRSKKIRCEILAAGNDAPICAHCKQYNIECTFFLPITETRFKKRRAANDEAASPHAVKTASGNASDNANTNGSNVVERPSAPTSIPFLLHAAMPTRQFEQYDLDNHWHWEVSEDAEGMVRVEAAMESGDNDSRAERLDKYVLPGPIISALVNKYFEYDHTFIPVLTRREFLATKRPHPLLLYSMCAVASVGREYPRHVFNRLRGLVNGLLRCNEILSHAKLEHIQAMLILAAVGETHAQPSAPTASAAAMRLASGIRMAQDLSFHREPKTQPKTAAETELAESRRRIWAVCVFLDRWLGMGLGLPQMIDIHDCDVLIPSPREVVPGVEPVDWPVNQGYLALSENLKLSLISGRILKLMYGPAGLSNVTDQQLDELLAEMTAWRANLPESLVFKGTDSSLLSGFMHIGYTAIQFLFWRLFIGVARPPPAHVKLSLDANRWAEMVQWSRSAIEWLNAHDRCLDTYFIFPYSATSCALIQYHTWARKRDPAALETLKLIRDVVQRWEAALKPDQMSIRRKSCETMTLLYEAALKTYPDTDDRTDRSEGTPASQGSGSTGPAFPRKASAALGNVDCDGPTNVEYSHAPDTGAAFFQDGEIDISFLDSIPDSNFDWSGW